VKRGELYWAELVPRSGSEQKGRRPVVVVSHDAFNQIEAWRSIIVVPLSTSKARAQSGPTAIALRKGTAGLKRSGVALCHQVTTLDRAKLTKRIGTLPKAKVAKLEAALKAALDLD